MPRGQWNGADPYAGFGKGTVKLEDFEKTQLIFVVGQNPGTNHPRMLTALQKAKRNGAKLIAVNPLPETGLVSFMNPQEPLGMVGMATTIADMFLQIKINGDVPLFKGILKALVEADDREKGSAIDWGFVTANTSGIEAMLEDVRVASWQDIERVSGITEKQIRGAAKWVQQSSESSFAGVLVSPSITMDQATFRS